MPDKEVLKNIKCTELPGIAKTARKTEQKMSLLFSH